MIKKTKTTNTILSVDINSKKLTNTICAASLNQSQILKKQMLGLANNSFTGITGKENNRHKTISFSVKKTTLKTKIKNIFFKDNKNCLISPLITDKFQDQAPNGQKKHINSLKTTIILNEIQNWRKKLGFCSKMQSNNLFFSLNRQYAYIEFELNSKPLQDYKQTTFLSSTTLKKKNTKVFWPVKERILSQTSESLDPVAPLKFTQYNYNLWRKAHTNLMINKLKTVKEPLVKKQNLGFIFYWLIPFVGFVVSSGPLHQKVQAPLVWNYSQNTNLNNSLFYQAIETENGIKSLKTNSYYRESINKATNLSLVSEFKEKKNNNKSFFLSLKGQKIYQDSNLTLMRHSVPTHLFSYSQTSRLMLTHKHSLELNSLGFFHSFPLEKLRPYYIQPIFNCFTTKIKNKKDTLFSIKQGQVLQEPLQLIEQTTIKSKIKQKLNNSFNSILPDTNSLRISDKYFITNKSQKHLNPVEATILSTPGLSVYTTTTFLLENGIKSSFVFSNKSTKSSFIGLKSKTTPLWSEREWGKPISNFVENDTARINKKLPLNYLFKKLKRSLDFCKAKDQTLPPTVGSLYKPPTAIKKLQNLNPINDLVGWSFLPASSKQLTKQVASQLVIPPVLDYKKCLKMSHPIIYLTDNVKSTFYNLNKSLKGQREFEKDLSSFTDYKPDFSVMYHSPQSNVDAASKTTFEPNLNQVSINPMKTQKTELNIPNYAYISKSPQALSFPSRGVTLQTSQKTTLNTLSKLNSLFIKNSSKGGYAYKVDSPYNSFTRFFSKYIHFLLTSIRKKPTLHLCKSESFRPLSFGRTQVASQLAFKGVPILNKNLRFEKIFRASLSNGISKNFLNFDTKKDSSKLNPKMGKPSYLTFSHSYNGEKSFVNIQTLSSLRFYQYSNKSKQKTFSNAKFNNKVQKQNKDSFKSFTKNKMTPLKLVPSILLKTQKFYKDYFVSKPSNNNYFNNQNLDHFFETKENNVLTERFAFKQKKQKKRRVRKLRKQTLSRKKRKRFYPRPIWLRYRLLLNFSALTNANSPILKKIITNKLPENVQTFNFTTSNAIKQYLLKNYFPTQSPNLKILNIAKDSRNTVNLDSEKLEINETILKDNRAFTFIKNSNLNNYFKRIKNNLTEIRSSTKKLENRISVNWPTHLNSSARQKYLDAREEYNRIIYTRIQKIIQMSLINTQKITESDKNSGRFSNVQTNGNLLRENTSYAATYLTKSTPSLQDVTLEQKETPVELPTNISRNIFFVKKAYKPGYKKLSLILNEYAKPSSKDPQDTSPLKRNKDFKQKTFLQETWMWLFNIGYDNLCWGSSFGLNNFELPSSINPIYLSWALNKTNNWFFAKLATKAKIDYKTNPQNKNLWALQRLRYQGKSNKTKYLQMRTQNFLDSFINGQQQMKISKNYCVSTKGEFFNYKTNHLNPQRNNRLLTSKLERAYPQNMDLFSLNLNLRSSEQPTTVKNSKLIFKLFNNSKLLGYAEKRRIVNLKVLQNWKRKEQKLRYLGFDSNPLNVSFQHQTKQQKTFIKNSSPPNSKNLWFLAKTRTMPFEFFNRLSDKAPLLQRFQSKIKNQSSVETYANKLNFLSNTHVSFNLNVSCRAAYYSLFFHFCALISLVSISQIRCFLKFNFLILFKFMTNSKNLINSILSTVIKMFNKKTVTKISSFRPSKASTLKTSEILNHSNSKRLSVNFRPAFNNFKKLFTQGKSLVKKQKSLQIHSVISNSNISFQHNDQQKQSLKLLFRTNKLKMNWSSTGAKYGLTFSNSKKEELQKKVGYTSKSPLILKTILLNMVERLTVKSLNLLKTKIFSNTLFVYSFFSLFTKNVKDFLKTIMAFSKNPEIFINDFVANAFLVEWSSDLIILIPENLEFMAWNSFKMFSQTIKTSFLFSSLSFCLSNTLLVLSVSSKKIKNYYINDWVLIFMSGFLQKILYSMMYSFIQILSQPDSDLIGRQKKGTLFWENWAEILTKAADKYNIVIPSLAILKEEQLMLTSLITKSQISVDNKKSENGIDNPRQNLNNLKPIIFNNNLFASHLSVPAQIHPLNFQTKFGQVKSKQSDLNLSLVYPYWSKSSFFGLSSSLFKPFTGLNERFIGLDQSKMDYAYNVYTFKSQNNVKNVPYITQGPLDSSVNQFVTTLSKDTDLFLDYHLAKSFSHISSIRYYHQVQNALGLITCSIFSGLFSKQQAKNILIIGKDNSHTLKSLLITALAGETELKMITDNANRYALIVGGVAVGIRLLRDVFDALALHAPCLFLLENIHAIGERRPFLFADSSQDLTKQSEEIISSGSPEMQLQMEEQNKIQAESSYHAIKHYKKAYKGEFSLGIPTNHFSFNLLKNRSQVYTTRTLTKKNPLRVNIKMALSDHKPGFDPEDNNKNDFLGVKNVFFGLRANTNKFLLKITDTKKIQNINMGGLIKEDTKQTLISRIQYKSQQLKEQKIAPPATSPLNVLVIKEQKKFKPEKVVQELGFQGLSNEKLVHLPRYSYSIRTKVALLAENALSNMSAKLDMITDLLMIFDSVRTHRGFVVFATTHIPSILDPALRRPGRLDETIRIPKVQNIWSRWQMFKTTISFAVGTQNSNLQLVSQSFPQNSFWSMFSLTNSFSSKKGEFFFNIMDQNNSNPYNQNSQLSLFGANKSPFEKLRNRVNISGLLQNSTYISTTDFRDSRTGVNCSHQITNGDHKNGFYSYKQYLCTLNLIDYRFTGLSNLRSDTFIKEVSILLTSVGTRTISPTVQEFFETKDWLQKNQEKNNKPFEMSLLKTYKKIKALTYYTVGKNLINTSMCYNLGLYGNAVNVLQENGLDQYVAFYSNKTLFKILLTQMLAGKITEKFVFAGIPYKIDSAPMLKNTKQEKIGVYKGLLETTLYGLKETCQTSVSLLFSLLQKKYTFNKNLIVPSLLDLGDTTINNRYLPESPPNSMILIPSKRYENYKRARLLYDKKREVAIGEKIKLHQQKQFILNLYNQQKAPINSYLSLNSIPINELSVSNKYYRQHILNRHRQYLTNQWWSLQLPEQNAETLFLSDLDWRYTFISLIGDFLIDYPDVEQFYNPNQKRGLDILTWEVKPSSWRRGKQIEKSLSSPTAGALMEHNFTRDIFEHYIYESFIKTFNWLDKNRELLDYSAYLYQKKGFIKENQIITNFKRFASL